MANISKMTSNELKKVLAEARDELARRDGMGKALNDIKKILTQYKLRAEDIDWSRLNKPAKGGHKKNSTGELNSAAKMRDKKGPKRDQRSLVAPKYLNPNSKEKWTGRGRAPSWVTIICEQENIDIEDFKLDPRFKL